MSRHCDSFFLILTLSYGVLAVNQLNKKFKGCKMSKSKFACAVCKLHNPFSCIMVNALRQPQLPPLSSRVLLLVPSLHSFPPSPF